MAENFTLTDLVNEATLVRYQEEYNATLKAVNAGNFSSEEIYGLLMNTNLHQLSKELELKQMIAWRDEGLNNGTLQHGTGTCPSGQFVVQNMALTA